VPPALRFSRPDADVHLPDGSADARAALGRVTHLCIGAHPDDIEIMAFAGIAACLDTPGRAFGGVVVTDGAGSSRHGPYAGLSDEAMRGIRRTEQRRAAELGRYAIQIQLGHASAAVKTPVHPGVAADLAAIAQACDPEVVYLHNPADQHDTHVAVLCRSLEALRARPAGRPIPRVLGCEVWRDLDWLTDGDKVALDAGAHPELAQALIAVFDSQVAGGKRYDLATLGRRRAHATYRDANAADAATALTWAIDLTPLLLDTSLSLQAYTLAAIDRLRDDVQARLARWL
jgi:LmbE family N-acetylglucosaminyl deacetylase